MLYQTPHPIFFPSNPFSSSTKFTPPNSLSSFPNISSPSHQVEKEMECNMKGGFRPEILVGFSPKQTQQVGFDEFANLNPQIATSVSGDDFFVDQLLNLNNEENSEEERNEDSGVLVFVKEQPFEDKETPNNKKVSNFLSPQLETERNRDDFGSVLSIPAEEEDLEWLSHFVEESFSQFSTPYPAGLGPITTKPKPEPKPEPTKAAPCFTTPPALNKSRRSKRSRTGGRVWSTSLAESSDTTSSPPSSPAHPKKQRRRENGPGGSGQARRCSHCGVQKTPQWRAGPMGAKTLCNACGVRFKSGRLLPEYRPACSPTFSSELHSNSHRKVLEMRKKKETTVTVAGQPEPGYGHPVQSFG